ncbi:MAG: SGNH/GDSL hydrolase family protein [Paracoccaceae bacterium]
MIKVPLSAFWAAAVFALTATSSISQNAPNVLILGDSQISAGAGAEYLNFFNNLPQSCDLDRSRKETLRRIGKIRTAAIGVRSTSLRAWSDDTGRAKDMICAIDEKFGVNAGSYGIHGNTIRYVQIGQGADYQFCEPNVAVFERIFKNGYYDPDLLVLAFLGNSAGRWANDRKATARDVQRTLSQIPKDMPCVFMTTTPVFSKDTNAERVKAQEAIADAFAQAGGHCKVVKGFTPQVRAEIEGNKQFFRLNSSGELADPLHPKPAAIRVFLKHNRRNLCDAIFAAFK